MNVNWDYIKSNIDMFPEYRSAVFEQGFLLTDRALNLSAVFPFYDFWREIDIAGKAHLYVHQNQKAYVHQDGDIILFLLGHAYDPFEEEWNEQVILKSISEISCGDSWKALTKISDLTGLFLFGMFSGDKLMLCADFESMRTAYYGKADGHWYVTSHEEIVSMLAPLTRDDYVEKLENYRWYHLYGEGLPGDITHYLELKKIICNNYVVLQNDIFSSSRFYPVHPLDMCKDETDYQRTVNEIANVMKVSLDLIAKKWPHPAVSVTGGRDSKGSLAAAAHLGDMIQYYSYNSQYAEKVDCDAAKRICDSVGVKHTTYEIPLDREMYPEYDLVKAILCVNSNRKYFNHNDIMKRIYFRRLQPFDVEVKSWTSEIGRAFYYKRYGVRRLQKTCTARRVNVMNNIYLMNPWLMYRTDAVYRRYLNDSEYNKHMFNYDWSDIIDLEMRDSRWGADVISCEHMFSHDITVPYNNRRLGDLFLRVPFEYRLSDRTHIDFTHMLCPAVDEANINVKDVAHNNKRMWMDKIYYFVSCIRPF